MEMISLLTTAEREQQFRRGTRQLGVVASALLLSACSGLTQPYVEARGPAGSNGSLPANPTFAQAQVVARNASEDFNSRLQDLETFDLATGTLLVGAGLAGVAFGLYDSHIDKIYGAGLAGGVAAAGRSFLPINTRKKAYIAGVGAISCAIASIGLGEPDQSISPQVVKTPGARTTGVPRGPLGRAADELRSLTFGSGGAANARSSGAGAGANVTSLRSSSTKLLQATRNSGIPSVEATGNFYSLSAKRLEDAQVESRKAAIRLLQEVDSAIDTRGARLVLATEAIINAVNKRIEQAAITPESSLEKALATVSSLNDSIKNTAKGVLEGVEKEVDASAETKERAELTEMMAPNDNKLRSAARTVVASAEKAEADAESNRSIAEKILALVQVSDSCLADLNEAGS